MQTTKPKWPRRDAICVAREVVTAIGPACLSICVAGSLRRGKPEVGDVEIVYIPAWESRDVLDGLFTSRRRVNLADAAIARLETDGILARRLSVNGRQAYGRRNKLMTHCASGIGVDLFATTAECWHNYLVCRTGPASSNTRIAARARARGYRWKPYGPGFLRIKDRVMVPMQSEEQVFTFVGLPARHPHDR